MLKSLVEGRFNQNIYNDQASWEYIFVLVLALNSCIDSTEYVAHLRFKLKTGSTQCTHHT